MCPGMRPATGWIAYRTSTPFVLEQVGQHAHVVLRLRDREPVARHEHDPARVREHDRDVLRRSSRARCVRPRARLPVPACDLAERAEEHVRDRPVHRPAHHERQQRAGGADERAADDQHVLVQREARRRGREPRAGVQERDHDRHVGAADRQDEEDAERERRDDHARPAATATRCRRGSPPRARAPSRSRARSRPSVPGRRSAVRRSAPAASRTRPASRRTRSSR